MNDDPIIAAPAPEQPELLPAMPTRIDPPTRLTIAGLVRDAAIDRVQSEVDKTVTTARQGVGAIFKTPVDMVQLGAAVVRGDKKRVGQELKDLGTDGDRLIKAADLLPDNPVTGVPLALANGVITTMQTGDVGDGMERTLTSMPGYKDITRLENVLGKFKSTEQAGDVIRKTREAMLGMVNKPENPQSPDPAEPVSPPSAQDKAIALVKTASDFLKH